MTTAIVPVRVLAPAIVCVGQTRLGLIADSDKEATVRLAEDTLPNKVAEQHLARRLIYLPKPTCLRQRQSQSGHLEVFTPNTSDKRLKLRRIGSARLRQRDDQMPARTGVLNGVR